MRKSLILSTLILLFLSFTAAAWDAPDGSPVISLAGRTAEPQSLETITLANPENGRIVVEIWVDEAGNVMRAAPVSDGSGTASFAMRDRCHQTAKTSWRSGHGRMLKSSATHEIKPQMTPAMSLISGYIKPNIQTTNQDRRQSPTNESVGLLGQSS